MEQKVLNHYLDNSKLLINKKMLLFLYYLIKSIFIKPRKRPIKKKIENKIPNLVSAINQKVIKNKDDFISNKYTIQNLQNILKFVKTQNALYAGEILENILILVFSDSFISHKENSFGKYLYNNMRLIKKINFKEWFLKNEFIEIFEDIENLLNNDVLVENMENNNINLIQEETALYKFLFEIYQEKYSNEKKFRLDKKTKSYIKGMTIDEQKILLKDKNSNLAKVYEYMTQRQYSNVNSCMLYEGPLGKVSRPPIKIMRSFFISVYIYSQNKHSPLMKYRTEVKDGNNILAAIPFVYDLTAADIEEEFAGIILAPSRIEPRIHEMKMTQNILKNKGFIELSKILLFNI